MFDINTRVMVEATIAQQRETVELVAGIFELEGDRGLNPRIPWREKGSAVRSAGVDDLRIKWKRGKKLKVISKTPQIQFRV